MKMSDVLTVAEETSYLYVLLGLALVQVQVPLPLTLHITHSRSAPRTGSLSLGWVLAHVNSGTQLFLATMVRVLR